MMKYNRLVLLLIITIVGRYTNVSFAFTSRRMNIVTNTVTTTTSNPFSVGGLKATSNAGGDGNDIITTATTTTNEKEKKIIYKNLRRSIATGFLAAAMFTMISEPALAQGSEIQSSFFDQIWYQKTVDITSFKQSIVSVYNSIDFLQLPPADKVLGTANSFDIVLSNKLALIPIIFLYVSVSNSQRNLEDSVWTKKFKKETDAETVVDDVEETEESADEEIIGFPADVPYDAAAKIAYEESDKEMDYRMFKIKYESDAVAEVVEKRFDGLMKEREEIAKKDQAEADQLRKEEAESIQKEMAKLKNEDGDEIEANKYESYSNKQLIEELKSRGLSTLGAREILIGKLNDADNIILLRQKQLELQKIQEKKRKEEEKKRKQIEKEERERKEIEDAKKQEQIEEWSNLTVAKIKEELRNRGLPVSGKKSDLIINLVDFDAQNPIAKEPEAVAEEETEDAIEEPEAVAEEETEDAIEEPTTQVQEETTTDWSKLTVPKLKEELRNRGLSVSGKKADLIATLIESDSQQQIESTTTDEEEIEIADEEDTVTAEEDGVESENDDVNNVEEVITTPTETDWSKLTVPKLKEELKSRGLPVSGKKSDLVAMLMDSDQKLQSFTTTEPQSETEQEEHINTVVNGVEDDGVAVEINSTTDWSKLTVPKLKEELRNRGLPISGRKADLVTALVESDNSS